MAKQVPNEETTGSTYQTGVTQPPKSRGGLVTALLMLVIFLSGVVTALSLMNIHLFRQLQLETPDQVASVSFDAGEQGTYTARAELGTPVPALDISYASSVDVQCLEYYALPPGLLLSYAGERAEAAGITAGDVLLSVDGQPVETGQQLQTLLEACQAGQQVQLELYRINPGARWQTVLEVIK